MKSYDLGVYYFFYCQGGKKGIFIILNSIYKVIERAFSVFFNDLYN